MCRANQSGRIIKPHSNWKAPTLGNLFGQNEIVSTLDFYSHHRLPNLIWRDHSLTAVHKALTRLPSHLPSLITFQRTLPTSTLGSTQIEFPTKKVSTKS